MELKKVLLFTGKFPSFGNDTDGGSILIHSLISALKHLCVLDVIFTRTPCEAFFHIEGVRNVSFETYEKHSKNKFERRLTNKKQLLSRLQKEIATYDIVIITHCSKAFGISELTEEERRKIILFPMYLSSSYKRSGESVPDDYLKEEQLVLRFVYKILTPSNSEKEDMVRFYGVEPEKIVVIPRGWSSNIQPKVRQVTKPLELLYIASIKAQKNTKEALVLLKELEAKNVDARLHLAGSFQNDAIMEECRTFIEEHQLSAKVVFHGVLSQKELSELIERVHVNISVSNWETFGRGIFEGMAGGLPTIVYDRLECVKQYVTDGKGICFVCSHEEFLNAIIKLVCDCDHYQLQARLAIESVAYLSEQEEKERLLKELL